MKKKFPHFWWRWLPILIGILIGVGVVKIWKQLTTLSTPSTPLSPVQTVSPFIPLPPSYHLTPFPPSLLTFLLERKGKPSKPPQTPPKPHPRRLSPLPKLVIIMDDIAFPKEVRQLKKLEKMGLKITPSFLPPTARHPLSAQLAEQFSHYMVHLPLEADQFTSQEEDVLKISDTFQKIRNRIWRLHLLYPRAKFFNNHTGSTFTANLEAMKKLFRALKLYNLGFIDSRTTPQTKGGIVASLYPIPFHSRNIFLDNSPNFRQMEFQLRRAISIARGEGVAIIICHPLPSTFRFLKEKRKWILKRVEVVYPSQLPPKLSHYYSSRKKRKGLTSKSTD